MLLGEFKERNLTCVLTVLVQRKMYRKRIKVFAFHDYNFCNICITLPFAIVNIKLLRCTCFSFKLKKNKKIPLWHIYKPFSFLHVFDFKIVSCTRQQKWGSGGNWMSTLLHFSLIYQNVLRNNHCQCFCLVCQLNHSLETAHGIFWGGFFSVFIVICLMLFANIFIIKFRVWLMLYGVTL